MALCHIFQNIAHGLDKSYMLITDFPWNDILFPSAYSMFNIILK